MELIWLEILTFNISLHNHLDLWRLVMLQMYGVLTRKKKHHLHRQFLPRNNVHLAKKLNIFLLIAICAWRTWYQYKCKIKLVSS